MNNIQEKSKEWLRQTDDIMNLSITTLSKNNLNTINYVKLDSGIQNNEFAKKYGVGSLTKFVTSIGIIKLHEENKLTIDDKVIMHLPKFKGYIDNDVTILDLLTHSSKYPSDGFLSYILDGQTERRKEYNSNLDFMEYIEKLYSKDFRDTNLLCNFYYYNTGYILLGKIIKEVTGKTYENYIINEILNPLNINECSFHPVSNEIYRKSVYEDMTGVNIINKDINPAGGLIISTKDYAKLIQNITNNNSIINSYDTIVESHNERKKFTCGNKSYYGMGVKIQNIDNDTLIYHRGAMACNSWFGYLQNKNVGIVLSCDGRPNNDISELGKYIMLENKDPRYKLNKFLRNVTGKYGLENDVRHAHIEKHTNNNLLIKFGYENNYEEIILQPIDIQNNICQFVGDDGSINKVRFTSDYSKMKFRRWLLIRQ